MTALSSDPSPSPPTPPTIPPSILNQLSALVDSGSLNTEPALIQIHASALFARLKALNRTANASVRARKAACADARTEVDATHLLLQNLQYEKRHLEREIEKCRQFG